MDTSCEKHLRDISTSLVEIKECLKMLSNGDDGSPKGKWKKETKRQKMLSFLEENSSKAFNIDSIAKELKASETYVYVNLKSFLKEEKVKRVSKGAYQWSEGESEEEISVTENDFSILG